MIRWLGEQPPPGGRGVEEVSERAAQGEDDRGTLGAPRQWPHWGGGGASAQRVIWE